MTVNEFILCIRHFTDKAYRPNKTSSVCIQLLKKHADILSNATFISPRCRRSNAVRRSIRVKLYWRRILSSIHRRQSQSQLGGIRWRNAQRCWKTCQVDRWDRRHSRCRDEVSQMAGRTRLRDSVHRRYSVRCHLRLVCRLFRRWVRRSTDPGRLDMDHRQCVRRCRRRRPVQVSRIPVFRRVCQVHQGWWVRRDCRPVQPRDYRRRRCPRHRLHLPDQPNSSKRRRSSKLEMELWSARWTFVWDETGRPAAEFPKHIRNRTSPLIRLRKICLRPRLSCNRDGKQEDVLIEPSDHILAWITMILKHMIFCLTHCN